jgi:hypothetical protein
MFLCWHPCRDARLLFAYQGVSLRSTAGKSAIVALVTTGTPHLGSRLGRFYAWLQANPRTKKQTADWDVADVARIAIDLRRPTIGDLSDVGPAIAVLNAGKGNLQVGISPSYFSLE